jgi:hypothetical protein
MKEVIAERKNALCVDLEPGIREQFEEEIQKAIKTEEALS